MFKYFIKRNFNTYLIKEQYQHKDLLSIYTNITRNHQKAVDNMLGYTISWFTLSVTGLGTCMYIMKEDIDKKFEYLNNENNKKFDAIDKKFDKVIELLNRK